MAGWICFAIGAGLLLLAPLGLLFVHPWLFLAAFVLSIVAMAKGKVGAGVILLLASIVVPGALFFGQLAYTFTQSAVTEAAAKKAAIANLSFEDVEGKREGGYLYIEGRVRNNGKEIVRFVKVQGRAFDKQGTPTDTEWAYAVGGEGLPPGGAKSFRIMIRGDKRVERFDYKFLED
jgi:hypothetical protein